MLRLFARIISALAITTSFVRFAFGAEMNSADNEEAKQVSDLQTLSMLHNTTHLSGLTLRERILLRFLVMKAETVSYVGDGEVDTESRRN